MMENIVEMPIWNTDTKLVVTNCVHCSVPFMSHDVNDRQVSIDALTTIFKLNYLTAFNCPDDDDMETNIFQDDMELWSLCLHCNQLLVNLNQLYNEFLQLGKHNSYLKKKMHRLDQIIQRHQQKEINCDLISAVNQGPHQPFIISSVKESSPDNTSNSIFNQTPSIKPNDSKNFTKVTQNPEQQQQPELRIVLTRLSDKYLISKQIPIKTDQDEDDYDDPPFNYYPSSGPDDPPDESDDDYVPEPPTTQKIKKGFLQQVKIKSNDDENLTETKTFQNPLKRGRGRPRKSISTSNDDVKIKKSRKRKRNPVKKAKKSKVKREQHQYGALSIPEKRYSDYIAIKSRYPNPCWYCVEREFETPAACFEHTKMEHLPKTNCSSAIICDRCSRICKNDIVLQKHIERCNTIPSGQLVTKTLECQICSKFFVNISELKKHQKCHEDIRPFPCDQCSYSAKFATSLLKHKNSMHPPDNGESLKAQCDDCGKIFKTEEIMKRHKYRIHTAKGHQKYREMEDIRKVQRQERMIENKMGYLFTKCEDCQIDFFSRLSLFNHRRDFHADNMGKQHICEICGSDFTKSHSLKLHMIRHSDDRPFVCELCGHGFKLNYNLKEHIRRCHTTEGRLKNNERMRERNRRKKILDSQLAKCADKFVSKSDVSLL